MNNDSIETVRQYWDVVWLHRDLDALDVLMHDPIRRHTLTGSETVSVQAFRDQLVHSASTVRASGLEIASLVSHEDRVWVRLTLHAVSLATMTPMPVTFMSEYRLNGGRIAEVWQLHKSQLEW